MILSGKIRIGTRGSHLAMAQARIAENLLKGKGFETEIVVIKSAGDFTEIPLRLSKDYGLFTKEINRALLENRIDIAVHSMKDIPTSLEEGLEISAVLKRGPVEDFFISKFHLLEMPEGAKVGTSSQRRRDFIKFMRPDIEVVDLRGNVDTRLKKYTNGEVDGIVLAKAGISRLSINVSGETLDKDLFVPQANQGAIALVTRGDYFSKVSGTVDDWETHMETFIERDALKRVNAGCHSSLGIYVKLIGSEITFHAAYIRDMKRYDFYAQIQAWEIEELLKKFSRWYNE